MASSSASLPSDDHHPVGTPPTALSPRRWRGVPWCACRPGRGCFPRASLAAEPRLLHPRRARTQRAAKSSRGVWLGRLKHRRVCYLICPAPPLAVRYISVRCERTPAAALQPRQPRPGANPERICSAARDYGPTPAVMEGGKGRRKTLHSGMAGGLPAPSGYSQCRAGGPCVHRVPVYSAAVHSFVVLRAPRGTRHLALLCWWRSCSDVPTRSAAPPRPRHAPLPASRFRANGPRPCRGRLHCDDKVHSYDPIDGGSLHGDGADSPQG